MRRGRRGSRSGTRSAPSPTTLFSNVERTRLPTNLYTGMPPARARRFSIIREPKTASASPRTSGSTRAGTLGGVLPVTVQQDDDVEVVLDGPVVAGLLVPAVAEVLRVLDHREGQVGALEVAQRHVPGLVRAGVVAHQDVLDGRGERGGQPVQGLGEGGGRVVGDDEDSHARRWTALGRQGDAADTSTPRLVTPCRRRAGEVVRHARLLDEDKAPGFASAAFSPSSTGPLRPEARVRDVSNPAPARSPDRLLEAVIEGLLTGRPGGRRR